MCLWKINRISRFLKLAFLSIPIPVIPRFLSHSYSQDSFDSYPHSFPFLSHSIPIPIPDRFKTGITSLVSGLLTRQIRSCNFFRMPLHKLCSDADRKIVDNPVFHALSNGLCSVFVDVGVRSEQRVGPVYGNFTRSSPL